MYTPTIGMVSPHISKYTVHGADTSVRGELLAQTLRVLSGVIRVDVNVEKSLVRIVSDRAYSLAALHRHCAAEHYTFTPFHGDHAEGSIAVAIEGMTCHSCDVTIERKWKQLPQVTKVHVNAAKGKAQVSYRGTPPSLTELGAAIADDGYRVSASLRSAQTSHGRPNGWQLVGLFALVLFLGLIASRLGWLKPNIALGASICFGAAFLLGLVAASSSCVA